MIVRRKASLAVLFCVCLSYLLERGPYRAIRFYESYDFSTVYAAARCWLHGENPYDAQALKKELREVGATPRLEQQQDLNPSVYLVSAMPLVAPISLLRWPAANVVWCLLSLAFFAASLIMVLENTKLSMWSKWIFGSIALVFSPTYVGLLRGNPSVLSIGLVTMALCAWLRGHRWLPGILLGAALCLKPQIGLGAICVFALWRNWSSLFVAAGTFSVLGIIGFLRVSSFGTSWAWWRSEQQNASVAYGLSSETDPLGVSAFQFLNSQPVWAYAIREPLWSDVAVWVFAGILVASYLWFRQRAGVASPWRDIAFSCILTITVMYHRYYDGQLLLLFIPLLVELWRERNRRIAIFLGICLISLAFPDQSVFAKWMGPQGTSLLRFILMRHQPTGVLAMGIAVIVSWKQIARISTPKRQVVA
jgi:hypothetical protein